MDYGSKKTNTRRGVKRDLKWRPLDGPRTLDPHEFSCNRFWKYVRDDDDSEVVRVAVMLSGSDDTDNEMNTNLNECDDCGDGGYTCEECLAFNGKQREFMLMSAKDLNFVCKVETVKYHEYWDECLVLMKELIDQLHVNNSPDVNDRIVEVLLTHARRLFGLCIEGRSNLNGLLEDNNVPDNMRHTYAVTWLKNHFKPIETAYEEVRQAYFQRDRLAFNGAIERLIAACDRCK